MNENFLNDITKEGKSQKTDDDFVEMSEKGNGKSKERKLSCKNLSRG